MNMRRFSVITCESNDCKTINIFSINLYPMYNNSIRIKFIEDDLELNGFIFKTILQTCFSRKQSKRNSLELIKFP